MSADKTEQIKNDKKRKRFVFSKDYVTCCLTFASWQTNDGYHWGTIPTSPVLAVRAPDHEAMTAQLSNVYRLFCQRAVFN